MERKSANEHSIRVKEKHLTFNLDFDVFSKQTNICIPTRMHAWATFLVNWWKKKGEKSYLIGRAKYT